MTLLNWQRSIEQIVVANKGARVLGFTSIHSGAGVSLICRRVAKTMSVNGMKTLIISISDTPAFAVHSPADRPAAGAISAAIVPSIHGYDCLPGNDIDGRPFASNVIQLRQMIDGELSGYQRIILDLPPISHDASDGLSSVGISAICDRTLLVCVVGTDRRTELSEAVALLRGAGARIAGIVSNEYKRVDPWQSLLQMFSRRRSKRGRSGVTAQAAAQ